MNKLGWLVVSLGLLGVAGLRAAEKTTPPRLAVVISVDQMRADYLVRFRPYFGEGGFKRLLEGGADYQNCFYQHAVTKTAPGHATILSGVTASVHGIVANEWLDRSNFVLGNAVEDVDSPLVGLPPKATRSPGGIVEAKAGRSPRNFLATTVGDRLKARYGKSAKVFGIADKDRAAILMAGPKADGAFWTEEGRFITSTFYRTKLPRWLEKFNKEHDVARYYGQTWDRLLDPAIYDKVQGPDDAPGEEVDSGTPTTFPKKIDGGKPTLTSSFYSAFDLAPWSNDMVAAAAEALIKAERLGDDSTPDLLCIGFSQTDKAGHAYGPDSHEVMDSYLRLDRTLAELFTFLEKRIGFDKCVIVLVADHAAPSLPERTQRLEGKDKAGRLLGAPLDKFVKDALDAAYGPLDADTKWAFHDGSGYHVNPAALKAKQLDESALEEKLKEVLPKYPMIAEAYTRGQFASGQSLPGFGERLRLSYYPPRSPDVMYIAKPNFVERALGTNHGTPYDYDSHVPLVWYGMGVKTATHAERVAPTDLAPTLAKMLGVELPAEAKGKVLF